MKYFILLSLVVSSFLNSNIVAQKYSNEFLSIGVGGRAQAMGNSVVASTSGIYAGVWNPAGLATLKRDDGLQLGAMHAEWFGGVGNFDYLSFSLPTTKKGNRLAFSLVRFGIDQIPNTLSLYDSGGAINFDNLREFSAVDYGFFGSYAKQLDKPKGPIRIGGSVKVIRRRIGPFANSWGFGADLGIQMVRGKWILGALAKDLTTTFNAWSFSFTDEEKAVLELTNNEIPIKSVEITKPQLILGATRSFTLGEKVKMLSEMNIVMTTDGQRNTLISADPFSIDPSLGLEFSYKDYLYLRTGVNQFQRELDFDQNETLTLRPNIGLGLKLGKLTVDYAYTDLGDNRNTFSHVVSLKLGVKPRERG